jgi:hypothetical protein
MEHAVRLARLLLHDVLAAQFPAGGVAPARQGQWQRGEPVDSALGDPACEAADDPLRDRHHDAVLDGGEPADQRKQVESRRHDHTLLERAIDRDDPEHAIRGEHRQPVVRRRQHQPAGRQFAERCEQAVDVDGRVPRGE